MTKALVLAAAASSFAFVGCIAGFGGDSTGTGGEALRCIDTTDPASCFYRADEGGCFVTGIGHIGNIDNRPGAGAADQDSFGGNAMGMKDGSVRGQWQNTTHVGDLFHGEATWLRCWKDDGIGPEVPRAIPNNALWGGPGKWNHIPGFTWEVHGQDRAEGGHHSDYYGIRIWAPNGELVYSEGDLIDGGNFQIHPPNDGHPYDSSAAPEPLPEGTSDTFFAP